MLDLIHEEAKVLLDEPYSGLLWISPVLHSLHYYAKKCSLKQKVLRSITPKVKEDL